MEEPLIANNRAGVDPDPLVANNPASPPRRLPAVVSLVAYSAVAYSAVAYSRSRLSGGDTRSIFDVASSALSDDDDAYSYSYLYECKNGVPSVPSAYSDGSWGSIEGDWYVIAATIADDKSQSGNCSRMVFNFPSDLMNQHLLYERGDTPYYWNYSGSTEYESESGVWVETQEEVYSQYWSDVFLVGNYGDAKYFGWYFCGPDATEDKRGIPWVLADDYSLQSDETFTSLIEEELSELGLLDYGNFTTYRQDSSCDYNWHHTASEDGDSFRRRTVR